MADAGGGSATTGEDEAGNGAAAASVKVDTVAEAQAESVEARARKRTKNTKMAALVGGDATLTTRRLDKFPKEWWTQMVRYFSLGTLVSLHRTCTIIKRHALPSKCLYIDVCHEMELLRLTQCQASVEKVLIHFCPHLYDPTIVVNYLGACTSLKAWYYMQQPRLHTLHQARTHLTTPVQVDVSQLTTLQTFLQKQKRCVRNTYVVSRWRV